MPAVLLAPPGRGRRGALARILLEATVAGCYLNRMCLAVRREKPPHSPAATRARAPRPVVRASPPPRGLSPAALSRSLGVPPVWAALGRLLGAPQRASAAWRRPARAPAPRPRSRSLHGGSPGAPSLRRRYHFLGQVPRELRRALARALHEIRSEAASFGLLRGLPQGSQKPRGSQRRARSR